MARVAEGYDGGEEQSVGTELRRNFGDAAWKIVLYVTRGAITG